jgi:hypothetical protein
MIINPTYLRMKNAIVTAILITEITFLTWSGFMRRAVRAPTYPPMTEPTIMIDV